MEPLQKIIKDSFFASLATNGKEGVWSAPVVHISNGTSPALYWISNSSTKHSQALSNNPEVALSLSPTQAAMEQKVGLQLQGFAHELQGDALFLAKAHAAKQQIEIPRSDKEYLEDDVWYVFFPYHVEIFDETKREKEKITFLDKNEIDASRKSILGKGFPYTFLWFDYPGYHYKLHKHLKPVLFIVLYGCVTFTYDDGSQKTVSKGEWNSEEVGSIHSAVVGGEGCVFLVGQIDDKDDQVVDL